MFDTTLVVLFSQQFTLSLPVPSYTMISQIKNTLSRLVSGKGQGDSSSNPVMSDKLVSAYRKSRINQPHESICNAPFTNMYFGHEGRVSACCFNRTHLMGSYPEMSISEIWNSSKANELRELLKKDDLTSGCQSCEVLIQNKNFDGVVAKNYDVLPINDAYPTKLEFELSNTCNLECIMCFGEFSSSIRKNREKKPAIPMVYDDAFIAQLEEFIPHLQSVRFFGGEPFLIDIYYQIWDLIVSINPDCQIVVQTNATVLNNRVKNLLDNGNFKINVSIDSIEEKTYEAIRINADFTRVKENIEFFHSYCEHKNTNLGISFCPIPMNIMELPEVIKFCNDRNAFVYFNTVWHPAEHCLANLSSAELRTIFQFLKPFEFTSSTDVERSNMHHYGDFVKQIQQWARLAEEREEYEETRRIKEEKQDREISEMLERTDSADLKEVFFQKIKRSVHEHIDRSENDRNQLVEDFLVKTDNVLKKFPQDLPFKKALHRLNTVSSTETVVKALETEGEDALYIRVKELYNQG